MSANGSPMILCAVRNSSGSVAGTDLTFLATGLYLNTCASESAPVLGVECEENGVDRVSKNDLSLLMWTKVCVRNRSFSVI